MKHQCATANPVRPESQRDEYVGLDDGEDEKGECVLNVAAEEEGGRA